MSLYSWALRTLVSVYRWWKGLNIADDLYLEASPRHRLNVSCETSYEGDYKSYSLSPPFQFGMHCWKGSNVPFAGVILLFSGYNQNVYRQYSYFIKSCIGKNFDVYAIDYPGHGSAPGRIGELNGLSCDDLSTMALQALSEVRKQYPPHTRINLVGFSMGSLILLQLLQKLENPEPELRCVFMSTVLLPIHSVMYNSSKALSGEGIGGSTSPKWTFEDNEEDAKQYELDVFISRQLPPSAQTMCTLDDLLRRNMALIEKGDNNEHLTLFLRHQTLWIHPENDSIMPKDALLTLLAKHIVPQHVFIVDKMNHSLLFGVPIATKKQVSDRIVAFCEK